MEQHPKQNRNIDISACLEAVNMYDADFHRDRGGDPYLPPPIQMVSQVEYWWKCITTGGTSLAGTALMSLVWLGGILVMGNIFRNVFDFYRVACRDYGDRH